MGELFGIDLPFYIVVVFLFSYLIWVKFRNRSSLYIDPNCKNSFTHIAEILSIFLIIILTSFEIFLNMSLLDYIRWGEFSLDILPNIWTTLTSLVAIIFSIVLLCFIVFGLTSENKTKKDFESFLNAFEIFNVSLIGFGIAVFFLSPSEIFVAIPEIKILSLTIFVSIFNIFLIWKLLDKKRKLLNIMSKFKIIVFYLVIVILTIVLAYFLIFNKVTTYDWGNSRIISGTIEFSNDDRPVNYMNRILEKNITRVGKYFSFFPIKINTSNFSFSNDFSIDKFEVWLYNDITPTQKLFTGRDIVTKFENASYGDFRGKKFRAIGDTIVGIVTYNYDLLMIRNNTKIVLRGIDYDEIPSEDYEVLCNDNDCNYNRCSERICPLTVTMTNKLNYEVSEKGRTLMTIDKSIWNGSICGVHNLEVKYVSDSFIHGPQNDCNEENCYIKLGNESDYSGWIRLELLNGTLIYSSQFVRPGNLSLQTDVSCYAKSN